MTRKVHGYRMIEWLCLLLVLVMSPYLILETGPLFQNVNMDNAIFLSIGKGMTEGKVPYVDVIENKGPLFFLMMALPQMIFEGTFGIYLLETIFLLSGCILIMYMIRWLTGNGQHPLLVVVPLLCFISQYSGHNFCEEYDLIFTLAGIAVIIHAYTGQTKGQAWRAFWLGVSAASVLLIKMSDILTLGVTVLFYFGYVLYEKKNFWKELLRFALGAAAVALPVSIYLLCVGAFGAMVQEYFLNNIVHVLVGKDHGFWDMRMYLIKGSYGTKSIRPVLIMALVLIAARFIQPAALYHSKTEKRLRWYLAAVTVANLLVAYVASSGFTQHLTLGQSTLLMAVLLLIRMVWQRLKAWSLFPKVLKGKTLVSLAVIAVFLFAWSQDVDWNGSVNDEGYQEEIAYFQEFQADLEGYEDSLFTIGITPCWYWYNGYYPAYPYYNIKGFIVDHVGANQAENFENALLENPISAILIAGDLEEYRGILTNATIDFLYENYYDYSECSRGNWKLLMMF